MPDRTSSFAAFEGVPESSWKQLSKKRIFFGHQSVGNNILDGIRDLMRENSHIKLEITEISNSSEFNAAVFAHSTIGKNRDPQSKIDTFAAYMDQGIGDKAHTAFMKFCYVDVGTQTDVKRLFSYYKSRMSQLKEDYPETTLIHVTVPLETSKIPFKSWFKVFKTAGWSYRFKMIKNMKNICRHDANVKRNEFNASIRREYGMKESVFDLARIESTHPDGRRETFAEDGKTYYSLVSKYTYDGGHLNETGCRRVAEQLLILLANLSN